LGLRPRPRWGKLTALPRPLAGFNWPTIKEKEGRGREGERKGPKGRGRKGEMGAKEMCKEEVEGEGLDIAWLDL